MKIQRIAMTLTAIVFLAFCVCAIILESDLYKEDSRNTLGQWIRTRPEKMEAELNDGLGIRELLFEYKGTFNRIIDKRYLYGIYKLENGYLATASSKIDLSDKLENLTQLHDWCGEHGIPLLYVNLPAKHENKYFASYGVHSYAGENADEFLSALAERGIGYLDLREYFPAEKLESLELFFKTDHHWKISSGLFTAQVLSQYINDQYQLGLDPGMIADDKMQTEYMRQCWVGEIGRKTSASFSGKDDFEYITPIDPGSFHLMIPSRKVDETGGFSVMINDSVFNAPDLYKDSFYYAYLFRNDPLQIIDNLEDRSGKILIIKDSYAQAVDPFLAMTADELTVWDVRYNETDLRDYLTEHPVDLVIVMYTESFIQSRMFNFFHASP